MAIPVTIYKFAEFTLNPAKRNLLRNGEEISLIKRDFEILRLLLEKRPEILSRYRIMDFVWGDTVVAENSIEKAITALRKILGDDPYNPRFIKTVTKQGYAFIHDVDETNENIIVPNFEKPVSQKSFSRHFSYILISSLLYALLFWIACLLEIAYQFDRFGKTALWLGFPVIAWIAVVNFIGLAWTRNLVRRESSRSLFIGLTFFVGGTILACLAMSFFLPNETITAARFQTQPAFAAFVKNSLIYFLPLNIILF